MYKCSIGYDNGRFYGTVSSTSGLIFDEMQPSFNELAQKIFLWTPRSEEEYNAKSQLLEMIKES
jgi:hypothetical protein